MLKTPEANPDSSAAKAMPGQASGAPQKGDALQLTNVTKFYGAFKAVDDVSFSLGSGCICGFLGPNGAGKTTTIRIILEIIKPTSGTISVLGGPSALEVRERIGYLPEEKGLYKKMKTWAVIAYFASLKGMSRRDAKARAYELLERYGLKEFAAKPTEALSKGMAQKVQMLASIAHDPELVILDEPFSGLDPVNQQVMEDLIRDLAHRGRTVLFSTHVMEHAERLCDRILLLAKGRKIFDGTIPEAKQIIPRRVRIETQDDIGPVRELSEVARVSQLPQANGEADLRTRTGDARAPTPAPRPSSCWELELHEHAEPQAILQLCFARGIRLRSFSQSDPTLHEVFVRLVGADAKEAGLQ